VVDPARPLLDLLGDGVQLGCLLYGHLNLLLALQHLLDILVHLQLQPLQLHVETVLLLGISVAVVVDLPSPMLTNCCFSISENDAFMA